MIKQAGTYSLREVSIVLGISVRTLYRLMDSGDIRYQYNGARKCRRYLTTADINSYTRRTYPGSKTLTSGEIDHTIEQWKETHQ